MPPLRITTWNVNGIRNPFGYQPWRDKRTFDAMFDLLETDIVLMQELKIQRKDLRDDMVLVPGWDCFFSLPKHKKGYSGVAVYTRSSRCAPIRAEEGVLGVLSPPGSSTAYRDLPSDRQIGGYPTIEQIDMAGGVDAAALDAEGRCVVLEFPAFVLFGVYSPANSNGLRDDFRHAFFYALDARIRNLTREGKRVVLCGDLNVSRSEIDTARAEESMRKEGMSHEEYVSTGNRRIFNQMLENGDVVLPRDEGMEAPVLWDTCREFHPTRKGMFTHWEQKINARPGNFGSRIDFVLCSISMKEWVESADIQEGLMGSDHCPVYATIKEKISIEGEEIALSDLMNPPGIFRDGKRLRDWTLKDSPALSGRLLPEFDRRRSIKDMFSRKPLTSKPSANDSAGVEDSAAIINSPSLSPSKPMSQNNARENSQAELEALEGSQALTASQSSTSGQARSTASQEKKRPAPVLPTAKSNKKKKPSAPALTQSGSAKGQQSLRGFFKPAPSLSRDDSNEFSTSLVPPVDDYTYARELAEREHDSAASALAAGPLVVDAAGQHKRSARASPTPSSPKSSSSHSPSYQQQQQLSANVSNATITPITVPAAEPEDDAAVAAEPNSTTNATVPPSPPPFIDPIVSKESWDKLFTKPASPRCEDHNEPCISLTTKKPGVNCGRAFWICPRPIGPSGAKERGTEWRCRTFIWASDWSG